MCGLRSEMESRELSRFLTGILISLKRPKANSINRYRLLLLIPAALSLPLGLIVYGWTAEFSIHWIVPIIGTFFIGVGFSGSMTSVQTYLVDAFTSYSASALAANNVVRSIAGGVVPLAGPSMYGKLGLGWGNTLLGLLALVFGLTPMYFYRYGGEKTTQKGKEVV